MKILVGVNAEGVRVGQDHQNAKLTDADVELLLQLRAQGLSYRQLAAKFEISTMQAWNIGTFRKRAQIPARWKVVKRPED